MCESHAKNQYFLLSEEALGRVECGFTMLVGLIIITRAAALKKILEFKKRLGKPSVAKDTWVNKVFGSDKNRREIYVIQKEPVRRPAISA